MPIKRITVVPKSGCLRSTAKAKSRGSRAVHLNFGEERFPARKRMDVIFKNSLGWSWNPIRVIHRAAPRIRLPMTGARVNEVSNSEPKKRYNDHFCSFSSGNLAPMNAANAPGSRKKICFFAKRNSSPYFCAAYTLEAL